MCVRDLATCCLTVNVDNVHYVKSLSPVGDLAGQSFQPLWLDNVIPVPMSSGGAA